MKVRTFFINSFHPEAGESALNGCLQQHKVLNVSREFVADGANSGWHFCVQLLDTAATGAPSNESRKPKVDYREQLGEALFPLFDGLRQLRNTQAEQQGLLAWQVLSNKQLAAIVKLPVRSLSELRQIEGVGESRVNKYGEAIVAKLQELRLEYAADGQA